jgi:predicted nucleic acid-binding protein
MKYHGVCIDTAAWLELADKQYKTYHEKKAVLDAWVVEKYPKFTNGIDMFSNSPTCAIKWSSAKQVIELFDLLDLTAMEVSKSTGKLSKTVGAKALLKSLPNEYKTAFMDFRWPEQFETKYDICLHYLLMKKTQQLMTTYGRDFLEYVHPITGKVHCNFRQYLNTGRMAATSPNALALPRSQEYRNCFIAPAGYKVWACDYTS